MLASMTVTAVVICFVCFFLPVYIFERRTRRQHFARVEFSLFDHRHIRRWCRWLRWWFCFAAKHWIRVHDNWFREIRRSEFLSQIVFGRCVQCVRHNIWRRRIWNQRNEHRFAWTPLSLKVLIKSVVTVAVSIRGIEIAGHRRRWWAVFACVRLNNFRMLFVTWFLRIVFARVRFDNFWVLLVFGARLLLRFRFKWCCDRRRLRHGISRIRCWVVVCEIADGHIWVRIGGGSDCNATTTVAQRWRCRRQFIDAGFPLERRWHGFSFLFGRRWWIARSHFVRYWFVWRYGFHIASFFLQKKNVNEITPIEFRLDGSAWGRGIVTNLL